MDILENIFTEAPAVKAPVSSRFKPKAKAKPRPKKGTSEAAQSVVVNATEEEETVASDSLLSVQTKVVRDKPEIPTSSPLTKTKDDVVLSATTAECLDPSETSPPNVSDIQNEKEILVFPDVSFTSSSLLRPCTSTHDVSMPSTYEDSDDFQINVEQLEAGDFSCLDTVEMMNEADVAPGKTKPRAKLKPKPKSKAQDKVNDMVESPANHSNATLDHSQNTVLEDTESLIDPYMLEKEGKHGNFGEGDIEANENANEFVAGTNDELHVNNKSPSNAHDEFASNGEENHNNAYEFADGTNDELHVNNKSPTNAHDEFASNGEENHNGDNLEVEKPKKKRGRKSKNEFVDGTNDELRVINKSPTNAHDELASNGGGNDNGDNLVVENPKKKRRGRPKKDVSENDKPTRKRNKASEEPDKPIQKPPKKFPRGTRRKRYVDKSFLEIPEESLDFQSLPIKDLILLAEHREREAKKQVNSVQTVPTDERNDDLQSGDLPYDDDGYDYDQDRDTNEGPSNSGIKTDTGCYNYNTYMKPRPRGTWTKKDTETFYQGIQQFGTDLSMIQLLFPDRSLEQIRSKYRKEQKQNPMRMDDALRTRATDNSCFELVIKTLEAKRDVEMEYASGEDEIAHPTAEDVKAEEITETHETSPAKESANSEHNHKDETANEKPDTVEAGSHIETYDDDDDDDDDDWEGYTGL